MRNRTKIPELFYVGVVSRKDQLPVAYMTPYGTDKSSQNRIRSINSYATNPHRGSSTIDPKIVSNELLTGFKIKQVSTYKSSDMWRVEDPRGFEADVPSNNILDIISNCTIENGEILEKCIWARSGPVNILLSTTSPEYKLAVSNTDAANKKASWRDVKVGNEVILQNNIKGIYLGKYTPIIYNNYSKNSSELGPNDIMIHNKQYFVILESSVGKLKSYTSTLHLIATAKLSSVSDSSVELSPKEAEEKVNEYLKDDDCFLTSPTYGKIIALSADPKTVNDNIVINPILITYNNAHDLANDLNSNRHLNKIPEVFVKISDEEFGKIRYNSTFTVQEYSWPYLLKNEMRRKLKPQKSLFNYGQYYYSEIYSNYEFNTAHEMYNLEILINTKLGNQINHMII